MAAGPVFVSHAQNAEDVMLWRALKGVGRGFYVDVGACEPDTDSVTLAFYERGWTGINLEPAPGAFARLDAARPRDINLQLAAGARNGDAEFLLVDGGNGLSTLRTDSRAALEAGGAEVEVARVPVRRLDDICRDHVRGVIHFLKIDAEGAEREVLEGAALDEWRPWVVVVEATVVNSPVPNHQAWEGLLLASRYRMAYADGLNRFYLAEEHGELAAAFATPPNVFDGCIRRSEKLARDDAAAATARTRQLEARLAEAQGQVAAFSRNASDAERQRADAERRQDAASGELRALKAQITAAQADAAGREAALAAERDHAVQEMWESNRLAGVLASDRQKLLDQIGQVDLARQAVPGAELAAVYASTSWRITAPVRALKRLGAGG